MSLVIAEKPLPATAGVPFKIVSEFKPAGDQPQAIADLVQGLAKGERDQVLLGVTGSGKTFTMAHCIQALQRPTLILAPNKTLAAQLYGEMKGFFPDNAVEYFVSYYDYYQPEAYVARTDTYIEKESSINEQIDRMRHSATRALFERRDVVIVASVSCIYGIGSPEDYSRMTLALKRGQTVDRTALLRKFVELQYRRNDANFVRGTFRARGDSIELFPAHLEDRAWRFSLFGDEVEAIHEFDPLTGEKTAVLDYVRVYANSHYVTPKPTPHPGREDDQGRPEAPPDGAQRRGQAAGGAAAGTAHHVRPGDDRGDRLLRGHRELFPLSHGAQDRRAAADAVRIHPGRRAADRRREPCDRAAARRHVQGRLGAQVDARRIRLPPALGMRQPAAEVRGVERDAAADRLRLGHARQVGDWSRPAACSPSR